MTKKIFAMFLAVLMVVSMLPTSVFAAEATCPGKGNHTLENCSYTVDKVTDPTCGTMGFTVYKCNVCGEYFSESWVPATGEHTWTDLPAKAPTCALPGYEAGKQCSVCGKKVPGATIPQLDKDATECEWVDLTPTIDCTTGGTKKYECKVCGATYELVVEKKEAHNFGEPVLKTAATATANGKAVVTCKDCGFAKEVTVFFTHDCVWGVVPQVDETCTTNGTLAHKKCRVCGELRLNGKKVEAKDLVIPAGHLFAEEPSCLDSFKYCLRCKKDVPATGEHKLVEKATKAPTCTSVGYKLSECSVEGCNYVHYEPLAALGHLEHKVSVESTCKTYAYTFAVCLRGCGNAVTLPDESVHVDGIGIWYPVSYSAFVMEMKQNNPDVQKTLYFNGKMDEKQNYYLGTTENKAEAAQIYYEAVDGVDGAIRMYFVKEGVKTYIDIQKVGTYVNPVLTAEPTNYYTWNATAKVWTSVVDGDEYYLGNFNKGTNIRPSKISYITGDNAAKVDVSQFPVRMVETEVAPTNLLYIDIDYKSGLKPDNHRPVTEYTAPTCLTDGSYFTYCYNHGCTWTETVVIPKGAHKWTNAVAEDLTSAGIAQPANGKLYVEETCTTDGYLYQKCVYCQTVEKKVLPKLGHDYDPDAAFDGTYGGDHKTNSYNYWECDRCQQHVTAGERPWVGLNHTWDTLAEAERWHGTLVYRGVLHTTGDCNDLGLHMYYCADSECDARVVYVKISDEFGYTGGHSYLTDVTITWTPVYDKYGNVIVGEGTVVDGIDTRFCVDPKCTEENCTGYKAPTCTEKGYEVSYKCTRCGKIHGLADEGHHNDIPANGHNMKANNNYKVSDCDEPNFKAYTYYCTDCTYKVYPTYRLGEGKEATCTTMSYTYYMCACGKEHIINFVGNFGHEMVEVDGTRVDSTCATEGEYLTECLHCSYEKWETIATKPHVNAAGEKFTDKCTDTVTDRHCVECHKSNGLHGSTGAAHDCTADQNKDADGVQTCPCVIGKVCHYVVAKNMPSTCLQDAYTLLICGDCGDQKVIPWEDSKWNGHRPENNIENYEVLRDENGEIVYDKDGQAVVVKKDVPGPEYLPGYDYVEDYIWTRVDIIDGEFVNVESERYTAKFHEYVPATYTSDGYWTGYCEECKQVVTQIIPKLDGLGFKVNIENANGDKEYTYGSLVSVTLTADALKEYIGGFSFDLAFAGNMVYVGYEELNKANFVLNVTTPEKVQENGENKIQIIGAAERDASGKMQNIEITENTQFIKLFFRVTGNYAQYLHFDFTSASVTSVDVAKQTTTPVDFDLKWYNSIVTRTFLDFNRNGVGNENDLFLAMSMLTGEHPLGKTYDVTLDIDQDGVVTPEELTIAYQYKVGNYDLEELLVMGISEEEVKLLGLNEVVKCNNSACQAIIDANATYCPHCGNHQ